MDYRPKGRSTRKRFCPASIELLGFAVIPAYAGIQFSFGCVWITALNGVQRASAFVQFLLSFWVLPSYQRTLVSILALTICLLMMKLNPVVKQINKTVY